MQQQREISMEMTLAVRVKVDYTGRDMVVETAEQMAVLQWYDNTAAQVTSKAQTNYGHGNTQVLGKHGK